MMINRRNFIKNAALGILAMNLFPEKISDAKILGTMIGGEFVYNSK